MRTQIKKLLGAQADAMVDLYRKCNPNATPSDLYFLIASDHSYGAKTMKVGGMPGGPGKGPVICITSRGRAPCKAAS